MRHFVVAVDGMTRDHETQFVYFIGQSQMKWWHRLPGFWLLVDPTDQMTVAQIRDKITDEIAPGKDCITLQVTPVTWSTFGDPGMSDWFKEGSWKQPG